MLIQHLQHHNLALRRLEVLVIVVNICQGYLIGCRKSFVRSWECGSQHGTVTKQREVPVRRRRARLNFQRRLRLTPLDILRGAHGRRYRIV